MFALTWHAIELHVAVILNYACVLSYYSQGFDACVFIPSEADVGELRQAGTPCWSVYKSPEWTH